MSSTPTHPPSISQGQVTSFQKTENIDILVGDAIEELLKDGDVCKGWMKDHVLERHLKNRYDFADANEFTTKAMNRAIGSRFLGVDGSASVHGIFRMKKKTGGTHTLYYVTRPGHPIGDVPGNRDTVGWANLSLMLPIT